MSTVAVSRFYDSTIGKKAVMAVTGVILFGFLVGHMLGNLQVFLGRDVMNSYAETLHANMPLLWGVRILLLVSVVLHTWAAIQLTAVKASARPVAYSKPGNVQGSTSSRTMMLSGPVIALFVIGHLLHLTTGTIHPNFIGLKAYENVVVGFTNPIASGLYVVAMILVGFHLSHGVWSMFQSMGFSHPRYTPIIKNLSALAAWVIVAGFISIPLAVMSDLVR